MSAVTTLRTDGVPTKRGCAVFDIPRSSYYYQCRPKREMVQSDQARTTARKLTGSEQKTVRALLNSPRFVDQSPRQVYAKLLDEGAYHCSVRTMYRILAANGESRERRNQRKHPPRQKPELAATRPNQLWSWDITKLYGQQKRCFYYLYVILDVFSRYGVGWMVAEEESAELAQQLMSQTIQHQAVGRGQLTLHADRGAPMTAITTGQLLDKLGVQKTHSRPYTPNDSPYSEAHFKTMKYRPDFPRRFDSIDAARQWAQTFFDWYNNHHYHSGLSLLTPATVHYGKTDSAIQQRNAVLAAAYQRHPDDLCAAFQPIPSRLRRSVLTRRPRSVLTLGCYSKFSI